MMASTPGTPTVPWARCADAAAAGEVAPGRGRPAARSAVSATITEVTPGSALTAASARLRTGSHAFTTAASTVIEKKTLPSDTTMSDKALVLGKASPSGLATRSRLARTSLFVNAMRLSKPAAESPSGPNFRDGTSTQNRIRCGAVNRTLPVDGGRHGGASRGRFAPLTSSVANTGQLYPPESDAHPLGTPAQRGASPAPGERARRKTPPRWPRNPQCPMPR